MSAKAEVDEITLGQLPPGFVKVEQALRAIPGKSVPVSQWVFSDGIASVSLCSAEMNEIRAMDAASEMAFVDCAAPESLEVVPVV